MPVHSDKRQSDTKGENFGCDACATTALDGSGRVSRSDPVLHVDGSLTSSCETFRVFPGFDMHPEV
jgi:hypothetical protein